MTVQKNHSPYFDDYNESKKFHEILFRPKKAVQVREMNQLQSMFYQQIKRFGDHVFENGSPVINGQLNYDLDFKFVTLSIPNYSDVAELLGSTNIELFGSSGITAKSKFYTERGVDGETFYLEYGNSSTDTTKNLFTLGESVTVKLNGVQIATGTVMSVGTGSKLTIDSGVYYIGGRFVLVDAQTVILDKSSTPSKVACLEYFESVVTENDDNTLYDNAQNTQNFKSPGAHRLKIDTNLVVYDINELDNLPSNAVEIFRIQSGELQKKLSGPQYNVLNDVLAQRTYEESGNYTVRPFGIAFSDSPNPEKFNVEIDSGLAYVNGYRIENLSKIVNEVDRARTTGTINNYALSATLGYYIKGTLTGTTLPDITIAPIGEFKDAMNATVGYGRVRFIRKDGAQYRFYMFDMKDLSGKSTTSFVASSVSYISTIGDGFSFNISESDRQILEASDNSLLFDTAADFVKDVSDISFETMVRREVTFTSGSCSVSAGSGNIFLAQDQINGGFGITNAGTQFTFSIDTVGGSLTTATIDSGSVGYSGQAVIYVKVFRQAPTIKTKSKELISIVITNGAETLDPIYLYHPMVYNIRSIYENGVDVTNQFTLYKNTTKSYNGLSYIQRTSGIVGTGDLSVNYSYYSVSPGDLFCVNSYIDDDFENIPIEDETRLTDVLDFRPIQNQDTTFTNVVIPIPGSVIRMDVENYLPRIDKVYVDSRGNFGVSTGMPATIPKEPVDLADSMMIYTLHVPAYTSNISDIQAKKINNRRYTMKDIGLLENRISNVEYYVSLNLLELEADAKQSIDPITGLNRFKNGFLTDRFVDHSVGDFSWPDYRISVSPDAILRPEFSLNAVDLELNSNLSSSIAVTGGLVTLPYTSETFILQNLASEFINVNPYAVFRWDASLTLTPNTDSWFDTVYADPNVTYNLYNNGKLTQMWNAWELYWTGGTDISRNDVSGDARNQPRMITTVATTNVDIIDDRVVDSSVVPYMRSIEVEIYGIGNRPESRLYFFFDNVDVNDHIKPISGNYGDPIIADSKGEFTAIFKIPNEEFRTGTRTLEVLDNPSNQRSFATSYGQTSFNSTGVRTTRQKTIVATRREFQVREWIDPIAQSFLIEKSGGVFATQIDVYFRSKDERIPITIQIREMENGLPTQRIIPNATKTLNPVDVNVSENGTVATSFKFDSLVYLADGNEYCFVISSNSNLYNVFVARMGEQDLLSGKYISEQPYAGVLFKSQNNSTWSVDQTTDIKFNLFTANFNTNTTGNLIVNNKNFDLVTLSNNPFETTLGSNVITVYRKNHNYIAGSYVTISDATSGNGIIADLLNKSHKIQEVVDPDHFTISTSVATATGRIGGSNVKITNTIQASVLYPNVPTIDLPNTNIKFQAKGYTGSSFSGTETPYQEIAYLEVSNKKSNALSEPWLISSEEDELVNTSGNKTLTMKMTLTSEQSNVSPVIDLYGLSIITPFVLIDNESDAWAKYRTQISGLKLPANFFKIYLDINKKDGSDVELYVRYGNDIQEVESTTWTMIEPEEPIATTNKNEYYESEYQYSTDSDYFTFYQVMIMLKSTSCVNYPSCKRLRILALTE